MTKTDQPLLLTVEEAGQELRLSRAHMYRLIGSGQLGSVKIGDARRIPYRALVEYVEGLP